MKTQHFNALINYIVNPFIDEMVNKTMVILKMNDARCYCDSVGNVLIQVGKTEFELQDTHC